MNTRATDSVEDDIEGYAKAEDGSWGEYPIDTLLVRTESRTVYDVVRRINQGVFVMNPDFQRDFIWPVDKQSKLIESALMRIPLPVFYLAENNEGKTVVVDGLQRLSTFENFLGNKLELKLPNQAELNGKKFEGISPKLQNRIEDCNLTLYILDSKVPEQARLDMFDRVNSGVPLSRQQMRNCLYVGEATKFLKDNANANIFQQATGGSLKNHKQMRDREFVNRFCAFQLIPFDGYRGDMDGFLAAALTKMNKLTPAELSELSKQFQNSLAINFMVFGEHAFRKSFCRKDTRSMLNASLWDVMSTGLSRYHEETVLEHLPNFRSAFCRLLEDKQFLNAITSSTNGAKQVKCRFAKTQQMFLEVFGAD